MCVSQLQMRRRDEKKIGKEFLLAGKLMISFTDQNKRQNEEEKSTSTAV